MCIWMMKPPFIQYISEADSGTLVVAGNPCLILELCQGSMGAMVTNGHSGHGFDPSERYRSGSDMLEKKQML